MDVTNAHITLKKIKFYLVFFCLTILVSCEPQNKVHIEQVVYENEKAIGVTFTTAMNVENIRFFIGEESQTSILGTINSSMNTHKFSPIVPFTSGQTYTLRKKETEILASFTIQEQISAEAVTLLAMHPKSDTVPENLLKMYFEFAQPMQEVGNALDFIKVTNDTDGEEIQPFLRLESELWNKERTLLTLWLDPGRIKTALIPNKEKGLPLTAGKQYTVTVDSSFKSTLGIPLKKSYAKKFYVGARDDKQPNSSEWQLQIKVEEAVKKLLIDFKEPMDAFLATETIQIYGADNTLIKGQFQLLKNGHILQFVPDKQWQDTEIEIRVASRLEDLAGNNLQRRFDTPILDKKNNEMAPTKVRILKLKLPQ